MLYNFTPGLVHPLPPEVVPGCKQAFGYRLSDQLLGLVPVCYCKGSYLKLDAAEHFVWDFLGRSGTSNAADPPTSQHGPLADDGRMDDDDNWVLGDLLTFGAPKPRSALKAGIDWLGIACEQVCVLKPATIANVVAVPDTGLKSQQDLPLQVILVNA